MCHRRIASLYKPLAWRLWSLLILNQLILAIECILNLWKVLNVYLVMYNGATASLYFWNVFTWNDVGYLVLWDICYYKLFSSLSKLLVSLIRNYFSETTVGCTAWYFVKIIWCSRWFWNPPIFRLYITLFAVAEGSLLLDIGWFVLFLVISHLFPLPCWAGSTVPHEGFILSVIIPASLLVCLTFGCRHSLYWLSNNFKFFSSGMHVFKHSYLCTPVSRRT